MAANGTGAFTTYAEALVIQTLLRTTPVYLALFESDPGEDVGGAETAYPNYARQVCAWAAADADGKTHNTAQLLFPANGGAANVTLTHFVVCDAAAGGNRLFHGVLAAPKTLEQGDSAAFATGALVIGVD